MVGANGGFLSKYSVGVYSAEPRAWRAFGSAAIQAEVDGWGAPARRANLAGEARVETYTIDHAVTPRRAIVIARTSADERAVAATVEEGLVARLLTEEPLGARVGLAPTEGGLTTVTAFTPNATERLYEA